MNDPVLFNTLVFLIAAFGLLVVAMMAMFFRVYVKLHNLQSNLNSEGLKIRKEAQIAAEEVISEAQKNAQALIAKSTDFNNAAKQIFDTEMKKATELYSAKYQELLSSVSMNIQSLHKQVSDHIADSSKSSTDQFGKAVNQMLADLKSEIKKEIEDLRKNLALVSEEERNVMKKEYEQLENQKIKLLEERIVGVVQMVARDSIHKSLTDDEHENLIVESLRVAQEKGVLPKNE